MIICDTGPIVSALNAGEGRRHSFAVAVLARLGRDVLVPWPVLTEVDLFMRKRGHQRAAVGFTRALLDGVHRLDAPTDAELETAWRLAADYPDSGAELPDLVVMAMSEARGARVLTWDFRHFRSVVLRRGHHWPLLVDEHELPSA